MRVEKFIAWRYLRAPRKEGFISVIATFSFIGIALGVAALIIVMSVMNGFRHELRERLLGFNGHLVLHAHTASFQPDRVKKIQGITSIQPLMEKQGIIMHKGFSSGCLIRGMTFHDLKQRSLISHNMVEGTIESFKHPHAILLGHKLARSLNVHIGQTIKIMRAEGKSTAFGTIPDSRHFVVSGIFNSGMHEYDKICVFMPLASAQDFFQTPLVSSYDIFTDNLDHTNRIKNQLTGTIPHISIYDWQQNNSHFFKALQVQSNVMFLILTLIVLVAVFNIISCLVMMVKDKTRDIAILRTLGATRFCIMRIFLLTGSWIGMISTLLGTVLGLAFALNIDTIRQFLEKTFGTKLFQAEIYFLSSLPSRVDAWEVGQVMVMALGLSFLATLYPAWKASRLNPVEGLRYE